MQRLRGVKLCKNDDLDIDYTCGREEGHQGKHVAFDDGGMVIAEWYPPDISGAIMVEFIKAKQ